MSVYTSITKQELNFFLTDYELGDLIEFKGIEEGIENTNFRLKTTHGDYILTLFEKYNKSELAFFVNLLQYLQQKSIVCPQPKVNQKGHFIGKLKSKPAAIFNCLTGASLENPTVEQCAAIGAELGKIHCAGIMYPEKRINEMGKEWDWQTFLNLKPHLTVADNQLINQYFIDENKRALSSLPKGIIHADLFKDNVLCKNNKITGVLDFYLACYDTLLLDLAITVNDWCCYQNQLDLQKIKALVNAYQQQRPLDESEKQNWGFMLRAAALKFWLSRLACKNLLNAEKLGVSKNPDVYKCIFIEHTLNPLTL